MALMNAVNIQALQGTTEASKHIMLETHGVALSLQALD